MGNSMLSKEIGQATQSRIPGLKVNRIRGLHDGKEQEWTKKKRSQARYSNNERPDGGNAEGGSMSGCYHGSNPLFSLSLAP